MAIVSPTVHAGRAPDVDGGIARARGDRQPGVGEPEQVETVSRELGPGRDLHVREDGLLGWMLGQGPVGNIDARRAGVVELDERVRRVGGRTGANGELVDLDRADVPHLLNGLFGLGPAVRCPRGVGHQVAVEGRRPGGDLEGRAHAGVGRDRAANVCSAGAPEAAAVHPVGAEMLNLTPEAGAPVVFVNVTVVSCEDRGENVWSPGGVAIAEAGARVSRATSYLAATTLACTSRSVASVGNVTAARS